MERAEKCATVARIISPTSPNVQVTTTEMKSSSIPNEVGVLGKGAEKRQTSSEWPTAILLISGIFVVLGGGFHFGFQLAIINPMADPLQRFLSQSLER